MSWDILFDMFNMHKWFRLNYFSIGASLCFEEDVVAGEVADDYACLAEWHTIQEQLKRSDVSVKNEIRNQLRLIAYPETTNLKAPVEDAKSKVADAQASQSKPSSSQAKSPVSDKVVVGSLAPIPISYAPQNPLFEHMPKFMHPYIEDITDVSSDGYCRYRAISLFLNDCEEDFELLRLHMKRELNLHREMYLNLFGGQDRMKNIEEKIIKARCCTFKKVVYLSRHGLHCTFSLRKGCSSTVED
ncbi:hypothetical protein QL285_088249 [Trifolium repens]|nr:hypothetical protein QL285_088249 [Trifolium repens]